MKAFVVILILLFGFQGIAQNKKKAKPIQLSGILVNDDSSKPVMAASVKIIKTDSLNYNYLFSVPTDSNGFFILMARPGDVISFKKKGYADTTYMLSDTLTRSTLSILQIIRGLPKK